MQEELYLKAMETNLLIVHAPNQTREAKREALERLKDCQRKINQLTGKS